MAVFGTKGTIITHCLQLSFYWSQSGFYFGFPKHGLSIWSIRKRWAHPSAEEMKCRGMCSVYGDMQCPGIVHHFPALIVECYFSNICSQSNFLGRWDLRQHCVSISEFTSFPLWRPFPLRSHEAESILQNFICELVAEEFRGEFSCLGYWEFGFLPTLMSSGGKQEMSSGSLWFNL